MNLNRMQQLAGLITEGKELRDYDGDDNYNSSDDVEELTKELNNLYWLDEERQKYDGDEYAHYIDGNTYVYLLGDAVILEHVDDEGDEIEKYRCADIEEMAEYIVNSYHGLNENQDGDEGTNPLLDEFKSLEYGTDVFDFLSLPVKSLKFLFLILTLLP